MRLCFSSFSFSFRSHNPPNNHSKPKKTTQTPSQTDRLLHIFFVAFNKFTLFSVLFHKNGLMIICFHDTWIGFQYLKRKRKMCEGNSIIAAVLVLVGLVCENEKNFTTEQSVRVWRFFFLKTKTDCLMVCSARFRYTGSAGIFIVNGCVLYNFDTAYFLTREYYTQKMRNGGGAHRKSKILKEIFINKKKGKNPFCTERRNICRSVLFSGLFYFFLLFWWLVYYTSQIIFYLVFSLFYSVSVSVSVLQAEDIILVYIYENEYRRISLLQKFILMLMFIIVSTVFWFLRHKHEEKLMFKLINFVVKLLCY